MLLVVMIMIIFQRCVNDKVRSANRKPPVVVSWCGIAPATQVTGTVQGPAGCSPCKSGKFDYAISKQRYKSRQLEYAAGNVPFASRSVKCSA